MFYKHRNDILIILDGLTKVTKFFDWIYLNAKDLAFLWRTYILSLAVIPIKESPTRKESPTTKKSLSSFASSSSPMIR